MKICNYKELDESFFSKIEFESICSVNEIICDVRKNGDNAVREYEQKFGDGNLEVFKLTDDEIKSAIDSIDEETIKTVECECKAGARGCADCKRQLGRIINEKFAPIRAKRQELAQDMDKVQDIINDGCRKANLEAEKVMTKVRDAVNI